MLKKVRLFLPEIAVFLFAFLTRFVNLGNPSRFIFDEVYHAFTAQQMFKGNPAAWEWWNTPPLGFAYEWTHPPLAKEFMVLGISIFGDNAFAWRFFSALFGFGSVVLVYLISRLLFKDRKVAILSSFLISLDGLFLVMSRIAMNDSYFVFFSLLALLLFLKDKKFLMAIVLGLTIASKWTGFFTIGIIVIIYLGQIVLRFKKENSEKRFFLKSLIGVPLFFLIIPLIIYLAVYLPFFMGHHTPPGTNQPNQQQLPQQQIEQSINQYTVRVGDTLWDIAQSNLGEGSKWTTLTGYNGIPKQLPVGIVIVIPQPTRSIEPIRSSTPFSTGQSNSSSENSLPFNINTFIELQQQMWWYHTNLKATHSYQSTPVQWIFDLRPIWLYVDYGKNSIANIYTLGNPLFMWTGIISIVFIFLQFIKNRTFSLGLVLLSYFGFFLPWIHSPRIMFNYHYLPSIPFLAIAIGFLLNNFLKFKNGTFFVFTFLFVLFSLFIYFYPLWTGIHVPIDLYNSYFWFKSWK